MQRDPVGDLLTALTSSARGRPAGAPLETYAESLRGARRADVKGQACPSAARRRAYALFERRPQGAFRKLARVVFDSWASLAPAARSPMGTRLVRFENELAALDGEFVPKEGPKLELRLALECDLPAVAVTVECRGRVLRVPLDDHTTGLLSLPVPTSDFDIVVSDADGEVLRARVDEECA